MPCSACGADNPTSSKFCAQCGVALARLCQSCASPLTPGARFCSECGAAVGVQIALARAGDSVAAAAASAELRLVSVLFADLVGFTALSERRDAEEVREFLTRYFETCRSVVGRYGGTIEKFIGDAVMAVWGAPVAHEDDSDRAVRAALDLMDAVAMLGADIGLPDLRARGGVLTGDAAVTVGAEGQGMVAGDLVNTASRIQAEAEPGTVLVGDATRAGTEAAVVYEDTGEHVLKGKAEPVRLWRALRVVAGRGGGGGGAMQSEGLEAPFVGRDRELRLIKDQFHASAEERRTQLISVVGIAGIGKSRLSWEFFKYIDGLAGTVYWQRGRCLAYGEGVTYWALVEMVRMRAGIAEGEDMASSRAKLQACLAEHMPDGEERNWVEPRLAQLLGLEENSGQQREDLFSAWRLFFERLAGELPTVLVFEDMQWADTSLLEFIEYLLEWSRNYPLYVVTSARPELVDHHPSWGAGKRNFASVYLEPLGASAMESLLDGLVPGLPDEVREQVLTRAEGVPLYAVETVRMLLDRGLLERSGSVYRLTGQLDDLAVPQSLQGLIGARLDGLRPEVRRTLQDAAVLGKTFTLPALAAVTGLAAENLEPLLAELVRKEVLSLQADPRSPERGQYGFLQDLVKRVAYETLSKRDRKERHLAVAAWFEAGADNSDVVEVVASHYLEAYNLAPDDADAAELRERAATVLFAAGERAASLAASAEAERYFQHAAQLVSDSVRQGDMHERAGQMAAHDGRYEAAVAHYERAIALYEASQLPHPAARVLARLGTLESVSGKLEDAVRRMEAAFAVLANDPPDEDLAQLAARLGSLLMFQNEGTRAAPLIEMALDIAEALWIPEVLSMALSTKAMTATRARHLEEAVALLTHAAKLAADHDLPLVEIRARFNLADLLGHRDRHHEALTLYRETLALARRIGDRSYERSTICEIAFALMQVGEWDDATEVAELLSETDFRDAPTEVLSLLTFAEMYIQRGDPARCEQLLSWVRRLADSDDQQARTCYLASRATWLGAVGHHDDALRDARTAMTESLEWAGPGHQNVKVGFTAACNAARALSDLDALNELVSFVDGLRAGERPPYLQGQGARFRGHLAGVRGDHESAERAFAEAESVFTRISAPFRLAVVQLEHAEWLAGRGVVAQARELANQAAATFTRLRAIPWVERADRIGVGDLVEVSGVNV